MPSLQYVIDTICAKFTVKSIDDLVKAKLGQGLLTVGQIALEIRCEDRSLDFNSSKMLAEAALEILEQRGEITLDGDYIYPVE